MALSEQVLAVSLILPSIQQSLRSQGAAKLEENAEILALEYAANTWGARRSQRQHCDILPVDSSSDACSCRGGGCSSRDPGALAVACCGWIISVDATSLPYQA